MKKRSLIPIAKNPKGVTLKSERQTLQIAFLFPLFLSLLILVLVPMASLLGLSFTNYKMTGGRFRFIGLENYIDLFTDKGFINAAQNTIFMVFFSVLLQMVVGVAAALAIQRMKRLRGLVQALIVMPMVIPPVVAGLIWRILLIPKYGGIHALLYGIGIQEAPAWLTDPVSARWVIVLVSVWEWVPFVVLFVIAALDSLPVLKQHASMEPAFGRSCGISHYRLLSRFYLWYWFFALWKDSKFSRLCFLSPREGLAIAPKNLLTLRIQKAL